MAPRTTDTRDGKIGQQQSFDLPASGKVPPLEDEITTVDTPNWKDKAKVLAFMDQMVEVKIVNSGGINEEQIVEVTNGGIKQYIMRGQWQKVKRKFAEVLARAKRDSVDTVQFTDATGVKSVRIVKMPALKYPFEMRDSNPDGMVWLQRVLMEP